jgi:AraC family transcriptional activator of pobA
LKNHQKDITEFDLSPLSKAGIRILNMQEEIREEHDISKPHRDNHFLFMVATNGSFKLNIDFKEFTITNPSLLCVFPEQVHHIIEVQKPKGWIVSIDPVLIDEDIKQSFERKFHSLILLKPDSGFYLTLVTLLRLIETFQTATVNKYSNRTINSLSMAFLNSIASHLISTAALENTNENRSTIIKDAFYQLLKMHYKTWKQPAQYASALAISVAHLNDTVKALTGSPVSIHIQQASILEAKRQLYFTNKSVKEIGYELGYDEPVYFGKLFKKTTNLSPLAFRQQFRE